MSRSALEASPGPIGAEWRSIDALDEGWREPRPGPRLAELRARGEAFAAVFKRDGPVRGIRTIDLLPFPYPVSFAFWQAAPTRAKYLLMRNRCQVIEFEDFAGEIRTLLVNPSEADLSARAGFFVQAKRELLPLVPTSLLTRGPGPAARLRGLGVDPARVDYVTFDHLHVQDLRRGLIGEGGGAPLYPNARLLVNHRELETLAQIHPLQAPWWIRGALDGVPAERVVALKGSLWLGKGLALVWTPGHTLGNHSIVVHAPDGAVYAISENGVAPECYLPAASKIRALREYARRYAAEVVLNGNSLESALSQCTAMVLEKALVDRGAGGGELPNILCSSPFVRSPMAWGLAPSHVVPAVNGGALRGSLLPS